MEQFLSKPAGDVTGALSGFDRLVFRGTLQEPAHRGGLMHYLHAVRVLLKDFAGHAEALTRRLTHASEGLAKRNGRPIAYLQPGAINKEDKARETARADGIEQGLICILTAVEPCLSYEIMRDRNGETIELEPRHRKCLHLYHYQVHPSSSFMHPRVVGLFSGRHSGLPQRPGIVRTLGGRGRAALRPARQLLPLPGTSPQGSA